MLILKISWKNIWRNKLRSIIVILSVAVGIAGGVFSISFVRGYVDQLITTAIEVENTHINIHPVASLSDKTSSGYIVDSENIIERLEALPGVDNASFRLITNAIVSSPYASSSISLNGIVPSREMQVTRVAGLIETNMGTYFEGGIQSPIIIGQTLAEMLNVGLRSRLIVSFNDSEGQMVSTLFFVAGIYSYINSSFEAREAFVLLEELAGYMGVGPTEANEIGVKLTGGVAGAPNMKEQLADMFPGYLVQSWSDVRPDLGFFFYYVGVINIIVVGLILLAISLGIINMMYMVVIERRAELGVLRAIGMNNHKVIAMVIFETVFLMLVGGGLGLAAAMIYVGWLEIVGIDLWLYVNDYDIPVKDDHRTVAVAAKVYPKLYTFDAILVMAMVVITGVFSAWFPALKALKTKPKDAIKNLKM